MSSLTLLYNRPFFDYKVGALPGVDIPLLLGSTRLFQESHLAIAGFPGHRDVRVDPE